jgi:DNA primase
VDHCWTISHIWTITMPNLQEIITDRSLPLVRVSGNKGGEYHGPCPVCGGTDRFHVWPDQGKDGTYWCRQCDMAGDAIQFLRDVDGLSFGDACRFLGRDLPDRPGGSSSPRSVRPTWQPDAPPPPPEQIWRTRAQALVSWAADHLPRHPEAVSWLAARGIGMDTARRFRLGWNPGEQGRDIYRPREAWGLPPKIKDNGRPTKLWIPQGLVIPWSQDGLPVRIRIRRTEGDPKYYVLPASSAAPMIAPPAHAPARAWVLVESELDAVLLAGVIEAARLDVGVVALGTSSRKPDSALADLLRPALAILLALDFDQAGNKALDFWRREFPKSNHLPPVIGKDPGEDYAAGVPLADWLREGLPPALRLPPRATAMDPGPRTLDGPKGERGDGGSGAEPEIKLPGRPRPQDMTVDELAAVEGLAGVDILERLLWSCTQERVYAVANDRAGWGARGCNQCWRYGPPSRRCDLPAQIGTLICNNPTVREFVAEMPDGRYHPRDRYVKD